MITVNVSFSYILMYSPRCWKKLKRDKRIEKEKREKNTVRQENRNR